MHSLASRIDTRERERERERIKRLTKHLYKNSGLPMPTVSFGDEVIDFFPMHYLGLAGIPGQ